MRRLGGRFSSFWAAASISALGDGLLVSGLPLLAHDATKKPLVLATVFAAGRLPWVFGLLVGSIVDRLDARRVLVATDLVRGTLLGLVGIQMLLSGHAPNVWQLVGVGAVLGLGAVVSYVALQRAVPSLVQPEELETANGYLEASNIAGEQFIGPAIGGALFYGGRVPVLGDATTFLLSALFLRRLPRIPSVGEESNGLWSEIVAGWRWFARERAIRTLTAATSLVAALSTFVLATEIVIVRDTLGLGRYWFALFTAVTAGGGIVGGIIAQRVTAILNVNTFAACVLANALCYAACIGSRSPLLVFTSMTVQTMTVIIANVSAASIRQRAVPFALRGRVIGLARSFIFGAQVPGAIVGGWIAGRYGTDSMFAVAAGGLLAIALMVARPLRHLLQPYQTSRVLESAILAPYQAPLQPAKAE